MDGPKECQSAPVNGTPTTPSPDAGDDAMIADLNRVLIEQRKALPPDDAEAKARPGGNGPAPSRDIMADLRRASPRMFAQPIPLTPEEIEHRRLFDEEQSRRRKAALAREEQEERRRALANLLDAVGPRYAGATLESYEHNLPAQAAVWRAIRDYSDNLADRLVGGEGIILFGSVGTGKDYLLIGAARVAIERAPGGVGQRADVYGKFRDLIGSDDSERDLIRGFTDPTILILSDAIPPRGTVSDFQAASLYRILDQRYRQCRPAWLSLNVASAEEADQRMGAAAIDRVSHGALCAMPWPSYRRPATAGGAR